MLNEELLGKIITIRSISGEEYITKLIGFDDTTVTVKDPRVVVIDDSRQVVLLPFALTANAEVVTLNTNNIFSIMESFTGSAADYSEIVNEKTTDK